MVKKLESEKTSLMSEVAQLKRQMNSLMIIDMENPHKNINDNKDKQTRDKFKQTEKIIAEAQAKGRQGNQAISKLNELVYRQEQLSEKLAERNDHIIENEALLKQYEKRIQDQELEKRGLHVKFEQEKRRSLGLSQVLS